MEFSILGPLEARLDGESVPLGGAKQRAVLAVLLLRQGEVVPVGRLVDEIWGDEPPPSAEQTLKSYVSRLRQHFGGHGPVLVRHGAGYTIDLQGAELDASRFLELHESATLASAVGEHTQVVELAAAALALWRGPALADVTLASAGRAEAERLEELRLCTYELRFDAELALGRHDQAVSELQALVAQNPYRERFVAQLMLALYRAGRHAEALETYEQTRRRLDDDLGLQPSTDLQQLSGQIVRQDPALRRPTPAPTASSRPSQVNERKRPAAALAATGVAVAFALVLATTGGAAVPEQVPASAKKLALVLPGSEDRLGVAADQLADAAISSEVLYGLESQTAYVDPTAPESDVEAVAARVRNGGVGLVVALGDGPATRALAAVVRRMPDTRFVFIDATLDELSLEGVENATAIRFGDEDLYDLGGYASGLVPTLDGSKRHVDMISVVAGEPTRDTARRIAGIKRGLRAARPGVRVRVDYSGELQDPTACELLANRQIDDGSDVVFALAGACGLGAVAVAKVRGVWSVGAEEDGIPQRDEVLMRAEIEWIDVTLRVIEGHVKGALPMGRNIVLGLEDAYATTWWFSHATPAKAMSAVVKRCSKLRASGHNDDF